MNSIILLLVLAIAISSSTPLQITNPSNAMPKVEEILAKYVQAAGGVAAHQKLTSRVQKGEWENATRGTRFRIAIYSKAPNKRVEILDASENRGMTARGFDGTVGWSMNMTETGLRLLEGAELATIQRESDFYNPLRLNRLYARLTLAGGEPINNLKHFVIEATPESGSSEKLYFDAESGLLSRRDTVYGRTPVQHYFEDYRYVDGVKLPFVIRSEGPVRIITRLAEIKHNVPIDDERFKSPSN